LKEEVDPLTTLAISVPICWVGSVVPYLMLGHSSQVLETYSLVHVTVSLFLIGGTIILGDAVGEHYTAHQGEISKPMILTGWLTSVLFATVLTLVTRVPSIFHMAGMVLMFWTIYKVVQTLPSSLFRRGRSISPISSTVITQHSRLGLTWIMFVKPIWESKDSKSIFIFLCINLGYMFIQLMYGVWTNSLGLISDAIHMFFDCFSLAVGLLAVVMAKWPPSTHFPFGYGRVETLSGFGNGIFLIFISIFILVEGVERVIHPPEMSMDRLLIVAVIGFVVNMVGIFSFHHGHGHGHGHSCGGHSTNMQGVLLHIMADALGSLGVIVSTLLIYQFKWTGFDPLASLLIGILIFLSTIPLIQSSFAMLMATVPSHVKEGLETALRTCWQFPFFAMVEVGAKYL
jgi:cation diffusion facilitator family transporter